MDMSDLTIAISSAVGGMVGMGGALGYGFKRMVDVLGNELKYQRKDIAAKLDQHILDCKNCSRGQGNG